MSRSARVCLFLLCAACVCTGAACSELSSWKTFYKAAEDSVKRDDRTNGERMYQEALNQARTFGATPSQWGKTFFGLGSLYLDERKYSQAEEALQKSLEYFDRSPGDAESSNRCASYLALAYQRQEKFREAEPLARRCLAFDELHLLGDEESFLNNIRYTAYIEWKVGDFAKAEKLLQRALQLCDKKPFPENADQRSLTLRDMADMYTAAGDFNAAEPLFKRALYERECRFYPREYFATEILSDYAGMLHQAGRTAEEALVRVRLEKIIASPGWGNDPEGVDVSKYFKPGPHDPLPAPADLPK